MCMGEDELHELQTALEQLRACVCSQDDDEFARILSDLEVDILEIDEWPVSFFEDLEEFLKDPNFLSLASSWKLLYFINNNWEHLSEHEKERLRDVLADTFDKHWNWMGAFVTSEILGNHYADEQTLGTLARLAKTARLPERSLAPHVSRFGSGFFCGSPEEMIVGNSEAKKARMTALVRIPIHLSLLGSSLILDRDGFALASQSIKFSRDSSSRSSS